jgi:hypothetical protein
LADVKGIEDIEGNEGVVHRPRQNVDSASQPCCLPVARLPPLEEMERSGVLDVV